MCIMFITIANTLYFHFIWEAGKPGCYVAAAMMAWLWTDVCHTYNTLYYRREHTQLDPENIVGYATHTGLDMRGDGTLGIITAKRRWEREGGRGVDGLVEECGSLWLLSKAVGDITAQGRGMRMSSGTFCDMPSSPTPHTLCFQNPLQRLKIAKNVIPFCDELLTIDDPMCIGCILVAGQ